MKEANLKHKTAASYVAGAVYASLIAGAAGATGSILILTHPLFALFPILIFIFSMFYIMVCVVKMHLFFEKNFDDQPPLEIEEDVKKFFAPSAIWKIIRESFNRRK